NTYNRSRRIHPGFSSLQKNEATCVTPIKLLLSPTDGFSRRAAMFEMFYDLHRSPFSRDLPTNELYESEILEETLGRLEYAAQRQWFAVVTGDCGTGKTTIRRFTDTLDAAK